MSIQSRSKLQKKRKKAKLLLYTSISIVTFVSLFIWFARSNWYDPNLIQVEGGALISEGEVRQIIVRESSRPLLGFISRNNWFLYPRQKIVNDLLSELPTLMKVELSIGFRAIRSDLEERKPHYLWCRSSKCFFVDNDGVVFMEAPDYKGAVYIKVVKESQFVDNNQLGFNIIDKATVLQTDNLLEIISENGFDPEKVEFIGDKAVSIHTKEKVSLLATLSDDYSVFSETISKILRGSDDNEDKISTIDARIENKVFLKYTD